MHIKVKDLKIEYSQLGKGDNLLLLHGWGGNIESLRGLQEILAKHYKVTNISLPGFAGSEAPKSTWSLKDYSLFLEELILTLGLKKPIVAGHSYGGKIAIKLALEFPQLISALILINASGIKPKNSLKKSIFGIGSKVAKVLGSPLPSGLKQKIKSFGYKYIVREQDYLKSGSLRETFKKIVNEHYNEELKTINIPTLIIWSEKDTYVPVWMGVKMRELIPNSRFIMVENETHGLPLKDPTLTAELIRNYLKN
jgi:pimeloyl-ACP methyl ester carboxylesterase